MTDIKTAPAGRTKKPSWLDWVGGMPAEEAIERAQPLLTREELLKEFAALGIDATVSSLSYWQKEGVIPYPTKKRQGGATLATYPAWMTDVIKMLRDGQAAGQSLHFLAFVIRNNIANTYGRPLSSEVEEYVKRQLSNQIFAQKLESLIPMLLEATKQLETASESQIGEVEISFHRRSQDDDRQHVAFNVTQPFIHHIALGANDVTKPIPDDSGRMMTWRLGVADRQE